MKQQADRAKGRVKYFYIGLLQPWLLIFKTFVFVSKVCADWEKIMFWISDADGQLNEEIDHFKAPKKRIK